MEKTWDSSPCSDCIKSPCCHYLPVQKKSFNSREDLLYALDLLNHQGIELGLYDRGYWMIYYHSQCLYYNQITTKCRVHNQALQPQICRDYKASHCWYKKAFSSSESKHLIRFNRQRMSWLIKACTYDNKGEIEGVPSWDKMLDRFAVYPLRKTNPLIEKFDKLSSLDDFDSSMGLIFEYDQPQIQNQWDLMNFRMNFRGITLFQGEGKWLMHLYSPVIKTLHRTYKEKQSIDFRNFPEITLEEFTNLYQVGNKSLGKITGH